VYNQTILMKTLAVFMSWVVLLNPAFAAKMDAFDSSAASQAPTSRTATIKERAVLIPAGSKVEVRLVDKQALKGRIGDVSDDGIVLKYTKAGQTAERKIAFTDMTSIKKAGWGPGRWALVGFGVFLLVGTLVCVAGGCPTN